MFPVLESLLNRMSVAFAGEVSAADLIHWAAERWPNRTMLFLDAPLDYGLDGSTQLTAAETFVLVNKMANVLLALGVRRFERVAIYKSNAPDYLLWSCAIMQLGAISVPIHSAMSLEVLKGYLDYTGASILITDGDTYTTRIGSPANLPQIQRWLFPKAPTGSGVEMVSVRGLLEEAKSTFARVRLHADSHVLIAHTSGTTGVPKGVLCTSGSLVASAKYLAKFLPATRMARAATAFPYNHKITHDCLLGTFLSGFPLWTVTSKEGAEILNLLAREKITAFASFPDILLNMAAEGLSKYDLSAIRIWMSAGDASHEAHMKEFVHSSGSALLGPVYVETVGTSEVGAPALARFFTRWSAIKGQRLVGRKLPWGPKVKVADAEGKSLRPGEVGRLMIKGDTLFSGYWNAHDRLHGVYLDGWWWTGDLVRRDRWGRHYHLDREADVIETQRGRAYSLIIEEMLLRHPAILEAVVLCVSREEAPVVLALVNLKPCATATTRELREWANSVLRPEELIDEVEIVPNAAIDRGLTGKVLKRQLRTKFSKLAAA